MDEVRNRAQVVARPEISVLMTVYNTAQFLPEAIESVLAQQTARTWELLIVDDGSTDASLSIAQRYAARYPLQVCVLQHREGTNRGISCSRNLAIHNARGARLAFLDSDDVWLPHHCETLALVLDAKPGIAMVYGAAERWVDHHLPFDDAAARAASWGSNYLPPLLPAGQQGGVLPHGVLADWFTADESLCPVSAPSWLSPRRRAPLAASVMRSAACTMTRHFTQNCLCDSPSTRWTYALHDIVNTIAPAVPVQKSTKA